MTFPVSVFCSLAWPIAATLLTNSIFQILEIWVEILVSSATLVTDNMKSYLQFRIFYDVCKKLITFSSAHVLSCANPLLLYPVIRIFLTPLPLRAYVLNERPHNRHTSQEMTSLRISYGHHFNHADQDVLISLVF